ncbi:hypothetical protein C8R44DRAFT_444161 [Mycena epipterygia]|nr:hypothetical protein C8R44DRAFT_444161 [Mycena epipterygia]
MRGPADIKRGSCSLNKAHPPLLTSTIFLLFAIHARPCPPYALYAQMRPITRIYVLSAVCLAALAAPLAQEELPTGREDVRKVEPFETESAAAVSPTAAEAHDAQISVTASDHTQRTIETPFATSVSDTPSSSLAQVQPTSLNNFTIAPPVTTASSSFDSFTTINLPINAEPPQSTATSSPTPSETTSPSAPALISFFTSAEATSSSSSFDLFTTISLPISAAPSQETRQPALLRRRKPAPQPLSASLRAQRLPAAASTHSLRLTSQTAQNLPRAR